MSRNVEPGAGQVGAPSQAPLGTADGLIEQAGKSGSYNADLLVQRVGCCLHLLMMFLGSPLTLTHASGMGMTDCCAPGPPCPEFGEQKEGGPGAISLAAISG